MPKTVYQILVELENDQNAKRGLEQIGSAAGLSGAALTAFSLAAGKAAADYEEFLTKVKTVSTEATGTTQEFDIALTKLSDSLGNSASKAQLANAAYDVLSSGYTNQIDVLGILEQSQKAAVGGFSDIAKVSDGVTSVMNSYGDALLKGADATTKAQKITDILIQTQNAGKITVDQYVSLIGQVAPTAAVAGVSLEELSAVVATTTANGLNASSSIAGLNLTISAIAKPTKEAEETAKALGIEFNAAALNSKGLYGIMKDITEAGGANVETMTKLFGSVEAVRVVANITGVNLTKLATNIDGMTNSTGLATKAFDQMSETTNAKAAAALNKLNNALVDLGRGVLVAIQPAIDALTWLIDMFNKLPTPIKQAIGVITLVGGAALTTAGAILVLSTAIVTTNTSVVAAIPIITGYITAITASATAALAAAPSFAALSLSMAPLTATILAVAAAIGTLAAAWVYWDNVQKEEESNRRLKALQDTQDLADAATLAAEKIRASGKALPKAEYDNLINSLKAANDEYGSLTGTINAIEKVQQSAIDGTLKHTEAQQNNTQATEKVVKSNEKAAESSKVVQDALTKEISLIEDNKQAKLAAIDADSQLANDRIAKLTKVREIEQKANQDTINELKARVNDERLTGDQRADIEASIVAKMREEAKSLSDYRQNLRQLEIEREEAQRGAIINQAKLKALELGQTDAQIETAAKQADTRFLQRQLEVNRQLIASTKAGTLERAQAEQKYYETALQLATNQRAINQQIADEQQVQTNARQKAIEDEKRAEEEAARVRQDALNKQLESIKTLNEARQAAIDLARDSLEVEQSLLQGTTTFANGAKSLLEEILRFTQDDKNSVEERNKALEVANNLYEQLEAAGISIQQTGTAEERIKAAINAIEIAKLDIKIKELDIAKEIARLEAETQRLTLEGQIAENEAKIRSGTLTEDEARRAKLEIDIANQKLNLLEKQVAAKQRSLDLQKQIAEAERAFNQIQSGVQNPTIGTPSNTSSNLPTSGTGGNEPIIKQLGDYILTAEQSSANLLDSINQGFQQQVEATDLLNQSVEPIELAIQSLEENQKVLLSDVKATLDNNQTQLINQATESQKSLSDTATQVGKLVTGQGSQIKEAQQSNESLNGLKTLTGQVLTTNQTIAAKLDILPRAIASLIPRQTPPIR